MKRTHLALILLILCLIGIATCGTAAANDYIINIQDYHEIDINVTDDDGKALDEDGNLTSDSGKPQKVVKADTILVTWNKSTFPNATNNQTEIIVYNSELGYKYINNSFTANGTRRPLSLSYITTPNPPPDNIGYIPDANHIIFTGTSDQIAIIISSGPAMGGTTMDMSHLTFVLENLTLTSDGRSPISVENEANVTFELRGINTLRGGTGTKKIAFMNFQANPLYTAPVYDRAGKAGLNVGTDSSITIKSKIGEKGTLIAYGGDGLNGTVYNSPGNSSGAGGGGAGIGTDGAHYWSSDYTATTEYVLPISGNITIEDSIIYAIGGAGGRGLNENGNDSGGSGAGIGGGGCPGIPGGDSAKAGNITIKDNNEIYVTAGKIARGENKGPAIGGGPTHKNTYGDIESNIGGYKYGCFLRIEGENTNIITFSNGLGYLYEYSSGGGNGIIFTAGNILQFDGGDQYAKSSAGGNLYPITYIVKDPNGNEISGVEVTLPADESNFTKAYTRPVLTAEKIAEIERIMELTGTRSLDLEKTYLFGAGSATVWGKDDTGDITFTASGYVDYVDNVNKIKQNGYAAHWDYATSAYVPGVSYGKVVEITMTPLMVQYESATGLNDGNSYKGTPHVALDIATAGITAPAGQVFEKWSGSDGNDYTPTDSITVTGVLTLTAQWTTPAYTVQYESDSGDTDGTLDPAGITYTVLDAVAAGVTAPVAGEVFDSWLGSDSNTYAPGDIITPMSGNLVLTAQWTAPIYTVQYESDLSLADGILDPAGTTYVALDVAASDIPIPGGVAFDYWLGSDGVSYSPGDIVPMSADLVLTAQWITASYTVQYESDSGELDGKSYATGAIHTIRGVSEADVMGPNGKVFDKWLGSDGNTYVSGSKITMTSNLVLTAQWKNLGGGSGSGSSGSGSSSGGGSGSAKVTSGTTTNVTPPAPVEQPQNTNQNNNNQNNNQNAPQTIVQQMDFDESKLIRTIAIVGLVSGLVGSIVGGALISVVGRKR